jgi:hypothetical protein
MLRATKTHQAAEDTQRSALSAPHSVVCQHTIEETSSLPTKPHTHSLPPSTPLPSEGPDEEVDTSSQHRPEQLKAR